MVTNESLVNHARTFFQLTLKQSLGIAEDPYETHDIEPMDLALRRVQLQTQRWNIDLK